LILVYVLTVFHLLAINLYLCIGLLQLKFLWHFDAAYIFEDLIPYVDRSGMYSF